MAMTAVARTVESALARVRAPRRGRALSRDNVTLVLFLAIPLTIYAIWVWGPAVATIVISFTRWDNVSAPEWIGLQNYARLIHDPLFQQALVNNLVWLIVFISIPMSAGLALAVVLDRRLKFTRLYQSAIYLPLVLSLPVIGLMFTWFFKPDDGLVNTVLGLISHGKISPGWLADPHLALAAVLTAAIWRHVGYVMVLYLAGLKGLDPAMREAAVVDGANEWQVFRRVTLPLLKPVTVIVLVITIIESLRAFDLVYVMTNGLEGPNHATEVLATLMFNAAIHNYQLGYGAAVAVVLLLISLGFIITYVVQVMRTDEEL
ncbi:MAG TPA: sugar ABC transporter permease [Ktedonobacterales bacterium]|nr:sugar ABC transporter permease [Ktedonobacterales bacterium]